MNNDRKSMQPFENEFFFRKKRNIDKRSFEISRKIKERKSSENTRTSLMLRKKRLIIEQILEQFSNVFPMKNCE